MRTKNLIGFLFAITLILSACGLVTSENSVTEVNRFVEVTRVVEVTRIVQVPQTIKEIMIVTAPPPSMRVLEITQSVSMLVPRSDHTLTRLVDGTILVVGGSTGVDQHIADAEIFDLSSGRTSPVASLHTARHDHSATLLHDGRVLVIGGYTLPQQWLADAEIYDPVANLWKIIPPVYPHGTAHTATLLNDGRVLVVGGCTGGGICTNRVEIFDPRTDSWSEAAPLDYDRFGHTATLLSDGRVLIAGGCNASGITMGGDALLYDPYTNSWERTGPMTELRIFAQAAQLTDGRILTAGGAVTNQSSTPQMISSAEIYDPSSNNWSATGSLSEARFAYTLTLLANGQVLAIGGSRDWDSTWHENSFVNLIEAYDPLANDWHIAGQLPQPAAFAASSLLSDGSLWVSGGRTGPAGLNYLSDSWIITPSYLN